MRKQLIALLLALCLLPAVLPAFAEEPAETAAAGGYRVIIDDAGSLLDESEIPGLREEMEKITEYCHAALYTYNGVNQKSVQGKAQDWYDANITDRGECVIFVIDLGTREISVSSTEALRKSVLTVGKSNMICDNVYKLATAGQYGECAKEAFRQIYTALNGGKITAPMKTLGNILMAVIGAVLLAYMLISTRMEQEVKVSLPTVATVTAGVGAAIVGKHLTKVVHHESSGGGRGGFGGGGGGGGSIGGGSHGF